MTHRFAAVLLGATLSLVGLGWLNGPPVGASPQPSAIAAPQPSPTGTDAENAGNRDPSSTDDPLDDIDGSSAVIGAFFAFLASVGVAGVAAGQHRARETRREARRQVHELHEEVRQLVADPSPDLLNRLARERGLEVGAQYAALFSTEGDEWHREMREALEQSLASLNRYYITKRSGGEQQQLGQLIEPAINSLSRIQVRLTDDLVSALADAQRTILLASDPDTLDHEFSRFTALCQKLTERLNARASAASDYRWI